MGIDNKRVTTIILKRRQEEVGGEENIFSWN